MTIKSFFINLIPNKSLRKKLRQKHRKKIYAENMRRKADSCCDIGNIDALLAKGTLFPHLTGIVISRFARVGRDCIFYQNVTVGAKNYDEGGRGKTEYYPQIGNNVIVYAGACIAGPVKIGNDAVIGANAVVLQDVPEGCLAVGAPAKIIRQA